MQQLRDELRGLRNDNQRMLQENRHLIERALNGDHMKQTNRYIRRPSGELIHHSPSRRLGCSLFMQLETESFYYNFCTV